MCSQGIRELHPVLSWERRGELLREGVERFNRGEFFAAHEAWEEIWRSTTPEPRELFQGLVQVAAGFHHYKDRGRPEVARRVLGKGRRRLEAFVAERVEVDVAGLVRQVGEWEEWLALSTPPRPQYPTILLTEPATAG